MIPTAASTYDIRIASPSSDAVRRTGWWNAVNNLMCAFSAMFSGGTGSPSASNAKAEVEIIYLPSSTIVARWRLRLDEARDLCDLISRDLNALDASDFETEWSVSPAKTLPPKAR
jgi:hypothetical protein